MSNSTSSTLASAQATDPTAPEQVETPPAKSYKQTHWTSGPFNPHRLPEHPEDNKFYVHIITSECLKGDAVRCVIKGVPEGSEVEADDYIRVGDIARLFLRQPDLEQPETPPAIKPNKTRTWSGTAKPGWTNTGIWSTKPTFSTSSSSRMPDETNLATSNSTMSLPISSSSQSSSTVDLSIISSTSSSSSTGASSLSLTTPCTKCGTTTIVSTTTTATAVLATPGIANDGITTIITIIMSPLTTITSSSSSTNGSSGATTGTPARSTNSVTKSANSKKKYFTKDSKGRFHHHFFTESSKTSSTVRVSKRSEPETSATEAPWNPDIQENLHDKMDYKPHPKFRRGNSEEALSQALQKNFHQAIAKLPSRGLNLIIKTHTGLGTTVEPTATDVDAAVNLAEDHIIFKKTPTSVKPITTSSIPSEVPAEVVSDLYAFMQTALPLAESEFLNPNNPSIKALTATAEGPEYSKTSDFSHGKTDQLTEEENINSQALVCILSMLLLISLVGMVGMNWVMVKMKRASKAAREATAQQKLGD